MDQWTLLLFNDKHSLYLRGVAPGLHAVPDEGGPEEAGRRHRGVRQRVAEAGHRAAEHTSA